MCGFLGEFVFKEGNQSDAVVFKNLLSLSKSRGPDSTCIEQSDTFQVGFNRLAILDLTENGAQPKESPLKRFVVVCNGEIYNYKELIKEYQLSNLKSTSDTEVLRHLLDLLGVKKTIQRLNGMFAISIFDTQKNSCYFTRDFAGIKPLFYGVSREGVVMASQFNQVFKHPWFKKQLELRKEIVKEYFGLGYMQAPNTVFKQIFQVNPGELIEVDAQGKFTKELIVNFEPEVEKKKTATKHKEVQQFVNLFKKAIKRQLASDVPLASFLSGGIDSPLVCAIAKELKPEIKGYTIGVKNSNLDESKQADKYAKHIQLEHSVKYVEEKEIIASVEEHFEALTEPFGDYSSIPTYLITKLAKANQTVMISGDGGDELFFGYPRMFDVIQNKNWFYIPPFFRKPLLRLTKKLKITNSWGPYSYHKIGDWALSKHLHLAPAELNKLIPDTEFSSELQRLYSYTGKIDNQNLLQWMRMNEFYAHMQRVLVKVDRCSMANSLEVRVPFLDKEIIEFALRMKPDISKKYPELKKVLKKAMLLYFNEKDINNKKQGFAVPIDKWLKNELKDEVKSTIFEKEIYGKELLDVESLKEYVNSYYAGKQQVSWGVWHIYAWQKWALNNELI